MPRALNQPVEAILSCSRLCNGRDNGGYHEAAAAIMQAELLLNQSFRVCRIRGKYCDVCWLSVNSLALRWPFRVQPLKLNYTSEHHCSRKQILTSVQGLQRSWIQNTLRPSEKASNKAIHKRTGQSNFTSYSACVRHYRTELGTWLTWGMWPAMNHTPVEHEVFEINDCSMLME
jgi:hypothetical protein